MSTIKDDTLVSSITIATPLTNTTTPVTRNLSKPHIPLSFLGITKQHKQFSETQPHASTSGSQVSSTTPESTLYKPEGVNEKEDSCLIEAMESHSAMISTPTNETTGHVYSFTNSQFGSGTISDQGIIKIDPPPNNGIGVGNLINAQQQQQIIMPSSSLIQQQKIIQHNMKQIHIQSQEQSPQMNTSINQDPIIEATPQVPSSLINVANKSEFESSNLPTLKETQVLGTQHATQIQESAQPLPVAQEKCKYSITNAESEVASISIKLPPSILSNQDRLESIVNTINKAITTPATIQKDSQQAAEMIASININSAISSPPQQNQQQVFSPNGMQSQQPAQLQAFNQGPNTMQIENNSSVVTENVSSGNNISTFSHQQLHIDKTNQDTQDWGFDQDGAEAKKIKVSPTEKEICDAAAASATNAINNISNASACGSTSIAQALSNQCFNEVNSTIESGANSTWANSAQSVQTFSNPVLGATQGTTFASSTAWDDEPKESKKVQIIEVVTRQPAPTLSTPSWSNAIDVSQGNKCASDTPKNSTNATFDAAAVAANVTNAINAAAESLKGSILDAQAATNALNAAAAAASATNSLNAATALAVSAVAGNHEPPIHSWPQNGNTAGLTNSTQTTQHSFNQVEAQSTFSQASNIWNSSSEQANSPESKEQGIVWTNNTIQQQQGSFDSGSTIDFGAINSSSGQNWSSKADNTSACRSVQVEQAKTIATSDVWQTDENLSPNYVSATNPSNNYSTPPSSVWNTDNQDPKSIEQVNVSSAAPGNATNTNSPNNLANWQAVNSPESLGNVQQTVHTQGATFSPVTNWTDGAKEPHNSPSASATHVNNSYNEVESQQQFDGSPQVWNNQHGNRVELKTATNIGADSQMWDLSHENASLQAQTVTKGNNLTMNASSDIQESQALQSNAQDSLGNAASNAQAWETAAPSNNVKSEKQGIVTEEWSSAINNDPMLSETSAGVIQQQQNSEKQWPVYNTTAKSENQWNSTTDNVLVSQQSSKSDWTSSFNQKVNSENPSNDNTTWPTFSSSAKPDAGPIHQPVKPQEQQKETQENWTFTDQSNSKWQTQPQEVSGATNKISLGSLDVNKSNNWPTFDEACKSELQPNQTEATWNNFKIETGKEASNWKVVSNQQATDNGLVQHHQEQNVQGNNWSSPSQQQQQVSQEKWLENKEPEKWLQGTSVAEQAATVVNETWVTTLKVENKVQQTSTSSSGNVWPEGLNASETKQPQAWDISAQQSVQSLPISVPGMSSSDVRSVLNNDTHHPNMNSSEMLIVDPKYTSLSVEQSTSLKESTPMEVDTASYDNPLLTPNPTLQ